MSNDKDFICMKAYLIDHLLCLYAFSKLCVNNGLNMDMSCFNPIITHEEDPSTDYPHIRVIMRGPVEVTEKIRKEWEWLDKDRLAEEVMGCVERVIKETVIGLKEEEGS